MIARLLGLRIFDVEASSICNLHCRFCPREVLPDSGLMLQSTFDRFLDEVRLSWRDTLSFVGMGEPTLNPRLPGFIREAKRRYPGAKTWVTSNGTTLSREMAGNLIDAGLDILDISFNGLDAATYEQEMPGAKYAVTLANVEQAGEQIASTGRPTRLQVNYIAEPADVELNGAVQSFWRKRGIVHFRPQRPHDRAGQAQTGGRMLTGTAGLGGRACCLFQVTTFFTWRGDVLYCCHDVARAHKIGNINIDPWRTILQRKKDLLRDAQWMPLCARCTDPLRFDIHRQIDGIIRDEVCARAEGVWARVTRKGRADSSHRTF